MSLFSHKTTRLTDASGQVAVVLRGRIASSNTLVSPLSGMRAAMFHLTVVTRRAVNESDNQRGAIQMHEVGSVILGQEVELVADADGTRVRVRAAGLVVRPYGSLSTALMLEHAAPPELAHLVASAQSSEGVVCVRETSLSHDDPVLLKGHVAQEGAVVSAGYRSDAGVVWVTRPEAGPVTLDEIIERPSW
jgi:hypothetical protein